MLSLIYSLDQLIHLKVLDLGRLIQKLEMFILLLGIFNTKLIRSWRHDTLDRSFELRAIRVRPAEDTNVSQILALTFCLIKDTLF